MASASPNPTRLTAFLKEQLNVLENAVRANEFTTRPMEAMVEEIVFMDAREYDDMLSRERPTIADQNFLLAANALALINRLQREERISAQSSIKEFVLHCEQQGSTLVLVGQFVEGVTAYMDDFVGVIEEARCGLPTVENNKTLVLAALEMIRELSTEDKRVVAVAEAIPKWFKGTTEQCTITLSQEVEETFGSEEELAIQRQGMLTQEVSGFRRLTRVCGR